VRNIRQRVKAAQRTLDKFKEVPFEWGRHDCGQMIFYHLRRLGRRVSFAPAGSYDSALGAKRVLQAAGVGTLPALLDKWGLPRIAPAAALPGDLVQMPGDDTIGAMTIYVGNGRVLGYHEAVEGAVVMQPVEMVAAWRAA
jgi:cell wall-associated NlpC family hydrolase